LPLLVQLLLKSFLGLPDGFVDGFLIFCTSH
jgi:hypothetical protein